MQRFAAEVEKLTLAMLMEDWGDVITSGDAAANLGRFEVDMHYRGNPAELAAELRESGMAAARPRRGATKASAQRGGTSGARPRKAAATSRSSAASRPARRVASPPPAADAAPTFEAELVRFRRAGARPRKRPR